MMTFRYIYGNQRILATHGTIFPGTLPVGPVNVIREDPVNRDILYAGTDGGVFVSKDGGNKWDILG